MASSLFGGAALGLVFGELNQLIKEAVNFRKALNRLVTTLESLRPLIKEIEKLNTKLGHSKELDSLTRLLEEGKQLVLRCHEICSLNFVAKAIHKKKIEVFINSLDRLISIDLLVRSIRDQKYTQLQVIEILSIVEKHPCFNFKAKEADPTMKEQAELSFGHFGIHNKEVISTGVLSVTVISAEDLPVSDFMGKADPFVVITLVKEKLTEEEEKQTKVVNNSLNPVWNEKIDFDVYDGLHDVLIVQVWDHDRFGKDYVGSCTLPITKVFREREYKERFKLVGASSSYLNLHLKWIPKQNCDDSKFLHYQMGILKIKLLQAKELPKKHIVQKPDASVELYLQTSCDKQKKSETINSDSNPVWNESFEFEVKDVSTQDLIVKVYDSKKMRSAVGCAQIRLSELQPGKVKFVWSNIVKELEIQAKNKIKSYGQVHLELLYCPFGMDNCFTNQFPPTNGIEANENENAVTQRNKEVIIKGVLSVTVISAEDLPVSDFLRKADPYVVLTLKKGKLKEEEIDKTKVVKQDLNPFWNKTFDIPIEDGLHALVIFQVMDKDTGKKDDYIGRCILSLTMVILEGEGVYTKRFKIDGTKSGYLNLHLKWMPQD